MGSQINIAIIGLGFGAKYVSCFGSGRIREELIGKYDFLEQIHFPYNMYIL